MPTRTAMRTQAVRRPRTPGWTYSAVSLLLLVLVVALAVTSRQTAPPTIAEFAPQAVGQITDNAGDPAAGRAGTSTHMSEAAPAAVNDATQQFTDVARVRQCVGDPPRQIEDPQSPPCVPYWSGDNGGATSHGVTRDEIRITDGDHGFGFSPALQAFFNKRFEFYGRRLRLIPRSVPLGRGEGSRAAARAAYEQDKAFAGVGPGDSATYYMEELARLGVVGVNWSPVFTEEDLEANRPYLWTYPMANDRLFATVGNWFCARLATHNAVHAGDPLLQATRRKPGIVHTRAEGSDRTSPEPMSAQFAACGAGTDAVVQSESADAAYMATFMENAILKMKTSGVTTIVCLCHSFTWGRAMRAATTQSYFPEWVLTDYVINESIFWDRAYGPPEQKKSLMLVLTHPMQRPYAEHPSTWAVQEVSRTSPTNPSNQWHLDFSYQTLLLLASGIQMAGPHLTPETFERGLQQTRFPNPAHRIMAGAVGFGERGGWAGPDHSMTDDVAEIWWSNTAPDPYEGGPGTFCYVDRGARRRIGTFPTDDPFFTGPCHNGTT